MGLTIHFPLSLRLVILNKTATHYSNGDVFIKLPRSIVKHLLKLATVCAL